MTRDAISWAVLAIVVSIAGWQVYAKYEAVKPCATPVHYAVGTIDPRFETSRSTLVTDVQTAAAIWNKAAGKTVLTYDPQAALKVNLVYDEREATAKLGIQIAQAQSDADNEKAQIDAQQANYKNVQDAYNARVESINASGGATRQQAQELNVARANLVALGNQINAEITSYNNRVAQLNKVVEEYNQTAGHTFEEGQYVRDSAGERINIFEFIGETQLTRVLAHEFGHAIGLDHNEDPNAIMYAKNESGNLKPSAADLSALKTLCGL